MEHKSNTKKSTNWEFNLSNTQSVREIPDPYSYIRTFSESSETRSKRRDITEVKMSKAKDLAYGQFKSIAMTMFSLFFIGSNLSLFTIFIIGITAFNSLNNILNVNTAFKPFENHQYSILQFKIIYVFFQSISLSFVLYKFYGMGLIPLNPADWISFIENRIPKNEMI
jgi:hypothetical protein